MPDIRQAKSLAQLYHTTLDDLIQYDAQVEEIQRVIRHTREETQQKVDWTKLWGEMYPVLTTYPQQVDIPRYTAPLAALLQDLAYDQDKVEKVLENPTLLRTPIVRNGKQATVGYQPEQWKTWE